MRNVDLTPREPSNLERAERTREAVHSSVAWLLSRQEPDGSWDQACDAGAGPTAQALVALAALGRLDAALLTRALDALEVRQRRDGAFDGYPGASEADLGTTACVVAALSVAASSVPAPSPKRAAILARAEAWLAQAGGPEATLGALGRGDPSCFFLVAAGLLSRDRLPRPRGLRVLLSASGRALLATQAHIGLPLALSELAMLRGGSPHLTRTAIALHDTCQAPNGSFLDMVPQTALAAITLRAAGVSPDDPRLVRLGDWLIAEASRSDHRQSSGWPVFHSSTWTTAMTLRALLRAGVPARSEPIETAARWLMAAQHDTPMLAEHQRKAGAQRIGGWAFQGTNRRFPDCDDTAVALDALTTLRTSEGVPDALGRALGASIARGLAWLWDMQNEDGGWSAYVHGLPSKPSGAILDSAAPFTRATIARSGRFVMGDPSTEDVTARVLRALAGLGFDRRHPRVGRALGFLERMRDARGLFWGRWSANYLWAGAHVLLGARAVGLPGDAPWLAPAHRFQRTRQNGDGGYGESVASYRHPALAGEGPSMAALSGLVLEAECALEAPLDRSVHRLAEHLLRTQRDSGSWHEGEHLQVMIPPSTFYRYPAAATFQPLEGLAAYRARLVTERAS